MIAGAYADTAPIDRATRALQRDDRGAAPRAAPAAATISPSPAPTTGSGTRLRSTACADPEGFALYYGNPGIALASEAWLGPGYQMTAQVNRVNPGGAAQTAHRDYHLGFMTAEQAARFPAQVHRLSPALTLQGAVAHSRHAGRDRADDAAALQPAVSSRAISPSGAPDFQDVVPRRTTCSCRWRRAICVFFNPALMHGAGTNRSAATGTGWRTCCRCPRRSGGRWRASTASR